MGLAHRLSTLLASWAVAVNGGQPPLVDGNDAADRRRRVLVDEQKDGIRTPWIPVGLDWRFEDIEAVWKAAEIGNMEPLARFVEAMRHVGPVSGLMDTRSAIVRLPVQFHGDPWLCTLLRGEANTYDGMGRLTRRGRKGLFRKMFPAAELIDLLWTGTLAGIAVAEMVDDPVTGIPVMHVRDLHRLRFDWGERVWKYRGQHKEYLVEPGKRWILFQPFSKWRPWRSGKWLPISLAVVVALTATYDRSRYQGWHCDPLKWIQVPNGTATDDVDAIENFIRYEWQRAPGIVLKDDSKAGVVESTGNGYQVYKDQHEWAERWIQFVLSGQTVTGTGRGGLTDGGDLFRDIAENIVQAIAEVLGETISEQGLEPWAWRFFGTEPELAPTASWDARSPERRAAEARALTAAASAVKATDEVLAPRGQRVNTAAYFEHAGVYVPVEACPAEPPPLPPSPGAELPAAREALALPQAGTVDE